MIVYLYFLHHIVYLRAIEMRKYKKNEKKKQERPFTRKLSRKQRFNLNV